MARNTERGRRIDTSEHANVRDLLFEMEPRIQLLEGVVALLRVLGEAQDSVEAVALATLADCCGDAVSEMSSSWRAAVDALDEA